MTTPRFDSHRWTLAAALSGALLISFSAIYYALSDVSPTTAAFFRAAYALPVLFVLWWLRRTRDRRPARRRWLAVDPQRAQNPAGDRPGDGVVSATVAAP